MGSASVEDLPGIGPAHGSRLAQTNYRTAAKLFGRYLMCDENYSEFEPFLKRHGVTYENHRADVGTAFQEWSDKYLGPR
uniref:Barrier to autointegration factor n=1 Tax=Steinernema glaseri TaxID=37863 RepID=A0A1I7ZYC6_9BILA